MIFKVVPSNPNYSTVLQFAKEIFVYPTEDSELIAKAVKSK